MLLEYEEKFQKEVESGYQSAREELAVLDCLAEGSKTLVDLIQGTGLSEERVRQILRIYTGMGAAGKRGDYWQIFPLEVEQKVTQMREKAGIEAYQQIPLLCA